MKWLVLALLLPLASCFRTTITNVDPGTRPAHVGVKTKHGFIQGIIESSPIHIDRACPNGGRWMVIEEQMTVLNSLLHVVTLGLYTPRAVMVGCFSGQRGPGRGDNTGRGTPRGNGR